MELNHRHTDFQSVALPTELSGLIKEDPFMVYGMYTMAHSKGRFGEQESKFVRKCTHGFWG